MTDDKTSFRREHRICALCRHLEMVESGREFPAIVDSEFAVFRCAIFGWTTREDYLMESEPAQSFAKQEPFDCPRWEGNPESPKNFSNS